MSFLEDLLDSFWTYYERMVILLPKLLMGLILLALFWWVGKKLQKLVRNRLTRTLDDDLLRDFIARLAKFILVSIGFLVFLKVVGLGDAAASLLATAGVSAFIIGFAFKDIGENFLAGVVMAFNRPFTIGDVIETNGITGTITAMSLRATLVKTFDGKDAYIPNALILKNPLKNYTLDGFLRYDFQLDLNYDADFNQVIAIIFATLREIPGILHDTKQPDVTLSGMDGNRITLTVYFWINTNDKSVGIFKIRRDAISACIAALSEANIPIPGWKIQLEGML